MPWWNRKQTDLGPVPAEPWACALCELQVMPGNEICPSCGLSMEDAFSVSLAIIMDERKRLIDRSFTIEDQIAEDLLEKEYLGG